MKLCEYASYDALGLADLIESGEVSKEDVKKIAVKAISTLNPKLNFMANAIDEVPNKVKVKEGNGHFNGVPFLLKEGTAMYGQPLNMASRLGVGRIADEDGEITKRFIRSGVNILGMTTAPEAGNSTTTESVLHGPTCNPWNPLYMPGGSSGGSAAAVASGAVPIAQANDGAGSIRIPAACCGLVGLKPTRARTPCYHNMPFSLTCEHIVSRTVRDTAAMLDDIHGPEIGAQYHAFPPSRAYTVDVGSSLKRLKIAFSTFSPSGALIHPDCIQGVEKAAMVCQSMGHHVDEVALPYDWEPFSRAITDLWSYKHPYKVQQDELATGLKCGVDTREACNLALLNHAKAMTMLEFENNMVALNKICVDIGYFFQQYDVFITPVTTGPALKLGELNANQPELTAHRWVDSMLGHYAVFTPIFNVTGQPAISLPLHQSENNLPIGVQFAARHSDEATLFKLAGRLEHELPWVDRKPTLSIFDDKDN